MLSVLRSCQSGVALVGLFFLVQPDCYVGLAFGMRFLRCSDVHSRPESGRVKDATELEINRDY